MPGGLGDDATINDLQKGASEADSGDYRCLDPSHLRDSCCVCIPPPSVDEQEDFELVGNPGQRNGEKLIRAFLLHTKEWSSQESREIAVAEVDKVDKRRVAMYSTEFIPTRV